jgi:hypothetical protein
MRAEVSPNESSPLADARSALMDSIRHLTLERHFSRAALRAAEATALDPAQWHGPVAWYQPDGSQAEALDAEMIDSTSARRRMTVYLYTQFGETALSITLNFNRFALLLKEPRAPLDTAKTI